MRIIIERYLNTHYDTLAELTAVAAGSGEKMPKKLERRVLVYMGDELADWLERKALEGYKKAAFIRRILEQKKALEGKVVVS